MAQCLSTIAAAKRIGVCRTTLYKLMEAGELRSITVGSRRLIPEAEIVRFIERRLAGEENGGGHDCAAA